MKLGSQAEAPPEEVGVPLSNFLHFTWNMRALCVHQTGE